MNSTIGFNLDITLKYGGDYKGFYMYFLEDLSADSYAVRLLDESKLKKVNYEVLRQTVLINPNND